MPSHTILFIIPNFGQGGAQRSFSNISNHLAKTNAVINIVFNNDHPLLYPLDAPIISLDVPAGRNAADKLVCFYRRVRRLKQIKKDHHPDVAISFLEGADYVNILSRHDERIVLSVRGTKKFDRQISGIFGWFRKKALIPVLYKRADRIVTVAEELAYEMETCFHIPANKLLTIPNSYDIAKIMFLAEERLENSTFNLFAHQAVILHAGRLHPQKEQIWMAEIFAQLHKKRPDTRLFFLGAYNPDNTLHISLLNTCRELGLSVFCAEKISLLTLENLEAYQVVIAGHEANPYKFFKRARIFALTSSWEGFPNVLAEAMICGCPVISSACATGPKELLAPGNQELFFKEVHKPIRTEFGRLLPVKGSAMSDGINQMWVEEILDMLGNENCSSVISSNAQQRMAAFNPEAILTKWGNLINGVA